MTVAPELAERLAKLLRLACSTGPDGEKLAAVSRLSAIVALVSVSSNSALVFMSAKKCGPYSIAWK